MPSTPYAESGCRASGGCQAPAAKRPFWTHGVSGAALVPGGNWKNSSLDAIAFLMPNFLGAWINISSAGFGDRTLNVQADDLRDSLASH